MCCFTNVLPVLSILILAIMIPGIALFVFKEKVNKNGEVKIYIKNQYHHPNTTHFMVQISLLKSKKNKDQMKKLKQITSYFWIIKDKKWLLKNILKQLNHSLLLIKFLII
jgi:hypothetical protein